jgi:hypothetical protein
MRSSGSSSSGLPLRVAAELAKHGQLLGRGIRELLGQAEGAGLGTDRLQQIEQFLQFDRLQHAAEDRAIGRAAHRHGLVDQPALADAVGFGRRAVAQFGAAQQVEGGEVHRCGATAVLRRHAAGIQVHVDGAVTVAQALFELAQCLRLAALEGAGDGRIAGDAQGIGLECLQTLLQCRGLGVAPGLQQLCLQACIALLHQEPEQAGGQQQADQAGQQAGRQGEKIRTPGGVRTALRLDFLGAALE